MSTELLLRSATSGMVSTISSRTTSTKVNEFPLISYGPDPGTGSSTYSDFAWQKGSMSTAEYGVRSLDYGVHFSSSCSALQLLPLAFFAHHYLLSPLCVPIPSETFEPGSETTKLRVTVLVFLASLDSFDSFDSIGTDVNDLGTTPHMYIHTLHSRWSPPYAALRSTTEHTNTTSACAHRFVHHFRLRYGAQMLSFVSFVGSGFTSSL